MGAVKRCICRNLLRWPLADISCDDIPIVADDLINMYQTIKMIEHFIAISLPAFFARKFNHLHSAGRLLFQQIAKTVPWVVMPISSGGAILLRQLSFLK